MHRAKQWGSLTLHVIHLAGTRMKKWGVDGLSRSDLIEEMITGRDALAYISLAEGVNNCSNGRIKAWIES